MKNDLYFLGQIKPEDAEQFQNLQPGKWGVYQQCDFWFISPITIEPFNHHLIGNKNWLKEDYGIEELLHIPHKDLLQELLNETPDQSEPWGIGPFDGATHIIFDMKGFKEMLKKEIENPTVIDKFV